MNDIPGGTRGRGLLDQIESSDSHDLKNDLRNSIESLFTELHACIPDESGIKALHRTKYEQWLTKNGLK